MFPAKPDFVFDIDDSVDLDALVAANDGTCVLVFVMTLTALLWCRHQG